MRPPRARSASPASCSRPCRKGALWWADERLLVVADLHLEKGSSFARRGQMLPPYDTAETLARLAAPGRARSSRAMVVALGDSFHDDGGAARLSPRDRAVARRAAERAATGSGSPATTTRTPDGLAGTPCDDTRRRAARLPPRAGGRSGRWARSPAISIPAARVVGSGRSVRRRCFAGDGYRLVLPAFGAYAGGLNVLDRAFAGLFAGATFRAFMLGDDRVYPVGRRALRPD